MDWRSHGNLVGADNVRVVAHTWPVVVRCKPYGGRESSVSHRSLRHHPRSVGVCGHHEAAANVERHRLQVCRHVGLNHLLQVASVASVHYHYRIRVDAAVSVAASDYPGLGRPSHAHVGHGRH
jgi:hypothetical protein